MGSNVLFISLLFLGFSCLRGVCGNAELIALLEIKAALDPENKHLSSWTSDGDPCGGSFEGVACNELNKVGNISLQSRGLAGKLPPAVAQLKCLSGLYLHYNELNGEIPREIANLTELTDLYLNVNNFSGNIPPEIGSMPSLKVLQLSCNQLTGSIPTEFGFLKDLGVLALEYNRLTGLIPASLGNLGMLKRVYLGFNHLSGPIPTRLATAPQLEFLDVQNNTLSGAAPPGLKRLSEGFHGGNNPGLCGVGFPLLRACTRWDDVNINEGEPFMPKSSNNTSPESIPESANFHLHCNESHCSSSSSSKFRELGIIVGVISLVVTLLVIGAVIMFRSRRRKQKVGNTSEATEDRLSADPGKELCRRSPSTLMNVEYSERWDPMSPDCCSLGNEFLQGFKYNLEEVESATQHFSEKNLLGKSKFSAVYRGMLKDGSVVAIKSINVTACKSEESEFMKGLNLLTSLKHDNLVNLRGFCCSKGRGECFLIYNFASNGTLALYLDLEEGNKRILNWPTRVSIIKGIAKGIGYLHSSEANKPTIIHQNISVEKILLDGQFTPLILDCGLLKLFAEDVVYSALKVSAALGYMAPEYITTGRFTEKSDVYAFGVIILQVLSGKCILNSSMRQAAESCNFTDFIDLNLKGRFFETEAAKLTKIALDCTDELPENRPAMAEVIEELNKPSQSND
nr:probable leucine-rich repeat receptor-like protein kinase At5g63930 [Ipomoea batatas]